MLTGSVSRDGREPEEEHEKARQENEEEKKTPSQQERVLARSPQVAQTDTNMHQHRASLVGLRRLIQARSRQRPHLLAAISVPSCESRIAQKHRRRRSSRRRACFVVVFFFRCLDWSRRGGGKGQVTGGGGGA